VKIKKANLKRLASLSALGAGALGVGGSALPLDGGDSKRPEHAPPALQVAIGFWQGRGSVLCRPQSRWAVLCERR
jgi:hypothetical protein